MLTSLDTGYPASSLAHPETSPSELVPEIVLPEQFAPFRQNGEARPPEHRLMLAVLEDAVHCHLRGREARSLRGRRLFQEVDEWFASNETDGPFAFVTICQVWSLDPDYIRSGLRRWPARRDASLLAMPFRIRHVSGSRHRIGSAARRRSQ